MTRRSLNRSQQRPASASVPSNRNAFNAMTCFAMADLQVAERACRDFGFMRKMRTWSPPVFPMKRTSVSRKPRGAWSSLREQACRRVHTRRWRSYAESIGDPFLLTCAAAATRGTTLKISRKHFFQHLLENETLQRASRERGRFRSFLLGALKRCLADEHMQQHTLKRGGRMQFISTDELEAEELHHLRADRETA